ncbi:hypothetical protein GCM10023143_18130 [Compostibacter hankyongensis]|uniref:Uncharacterized protein n=1 Tax=Compostibacter hankyongensis TaxID=1007089 RepID=A0ABP8FS78_9BACT
MVNNILTLNNMKYTIYHRVSTEFEITQSVMLKDGYIHTEKRSLANYNEGMSLLEGLELQAVIGLLYGLGARGQIVR